MERMKWMYIVLGMGIGMILSVGVYKIIDTKPSFDEPSIPMQVEKSRIMNKKKHLNESQKVYEKVYGQKEKPTPKIIIDIQSGDTSEKVAKILKEKKLIQSEKAFLLKINKNGLERKIQCGKYEFELGDSKEYIIQRIIKGSTTKK